MHRPETLRSLLSIATLVAGSILAGGCSLDFRRFAPQDAQADGDAVDAADVVDVSSTACGAQGQSCCAGSMCNGALACTGGLCQ